MTKQPIAVETGPEATVREIPILDEPSGARELAMRVKHAVRRATSARIHNLAVKVTGTHIVLHGFCSTFHCFQLAQHAAMRLADDLLIDNQIEVL